MVCALQKCTKQTLSHCCMRRKPTEQFTIRLIITYRPLQWLSVCKTASRSSHVFLFFTYLWLGVFVRSFDRSLWAGVQPTLDSSAWAVSRPNALARERGGELVGVCGVCATCRRGGLSRHEQLVQYLPMRPVKAWPTVWLAWLGIMQRQPISAYAAPAAADAYAA